MSRQGGSGHLERHQVLVYVSAIMAGLAIGSAAPGVGTTLDVAVWPTLGLLLYVTFFQVPLHRLSEALRDVRFISAVLTGNFIVIPMVVWLLLAALRVDAAVRLGVVLVLVAPCTDWYITFTHLAGGDTRRAIAVTPLNLLLQLALLPLYVWWFTGESLAELVGINRAIAVFSTVILVPFIAARLTQRGFGGAGTRAWMPLRSKWLPVVLVATVLLFVSASQVTSVIESPTVLGRLALIFVAFLIAAALVGRAVSSLFRLDYASTRSVIFSAGSRNSFVVLPFALALPDPWSAAVVVVVFQTLIELGGMVAYLWGVPRMVPSRGWTHD